MDCPTSWEILNQELRSLLRRRQELAYEVQKCYQVLCQHDAIAQHSKKRENEDSNISNDIDVEPLLKLRKHIMRLEVEHENLTDVVCKIQAELDRTPKNERMEQKKANRQFEEPRRMEEPSRQRSGTSINPSNCCSCCGCAYNDDDRHGRRNPLNGRSRSDTNRSNTFCSRREYRSKKTKEITERERTERERSDRPERKDKKSKRSSSKTKSNSSVNSRKCCFKKSKSKSESSITNCDSWEMNHPPKRVEIISVIVRVFPSSPGRKAGLHPGDLIVRFGEINAQTYNGDPDSLRAYAESNENGRIPMTIFRGGKIIKKTFTPRKWNGCGLLGFRFGNVFK